MKDRSFLEQNGVNVSKALELFGDMETYDDTLKEFITEIVEKKANLQKYKEVSDMQNYAIYAHSIKSDAKYFGFEHLAELALDHEMAGKQNNMYYVTNNFEEFMKEISKTENICKKYMGIAVEENDDIVIKYADIAIMVVDDSPVIKKFIQSIFHNKYEVIESSDGAEAINQLTVNPNIKKMILDLNMPNFNGFEVLKYLYENNLFGKIEVTVITGVGEEELINSVKKYPIKGVILKPFNERDIKNAIEEETI